MALEAQFAPLRALATPPAQTAASPVSERGRVSRTHSTENLMTTVRWFTYALSFNCACISKHQWILGYVRSLRSIGIVRPIRRARARPPARAQRGDRARDSIALPSLKRELFRCFTAYIA
eukprot:scaffold32968_cov75-Phaeocystis_antarctica.AAC.1